MLFLVFNWVVYLPTEHTERPLKNQRRVWIHQSFCNPWLKGQSNKIFWNFEIFFLNMSIFDRLRCDASTAEAFSNAIINQPKSKKWNGHRISLKGPEGAVLWKKRIQKIRETVPLSQHLKIKDQPLLFTSPRTWSAIFDIKKPTKPLTLFTNMAGSNTRHLIWTGPVFGKKDFFGWNKEKHGFSASENMIKFLVPTKHKLQVVVTTCSVSNQ